MVQEVYIIDDDDSSILVFRELFKNDPEYKFINIKSEQIDVALKNIPSLIIINEDAVDRDVVELCKQIRTDEDNTITPVIVVSSNSEKSHRVKILQEAIEYFIKKPVDEEYLYYTVKNLSRLLASNRRVSPLTGLPGNVHHPKVIEQMKLIVKKAQNANVAVGTFVDTSKDALYWKSLGVKYIANSVDVGIFYSACRAIVTSIKIG